MKKFLLLLVGIGASLSMAQAQTCPEADYDGCTGDGYSIVETEPNVYWPHNQMDAAHVLGFHTVHHRSVKRHHRIRRHHTRHHRRRHHAKRCVCHCR